MKKRRAFRFLAFAACLVFCALLLPGVRAEEEPAKEMTRGCRFQKNGNDSPALYAFDRKPNTVCPLGEKDVLSIQPKNRNETMGALYFSLDRQEAGLTLRQYDREGTLLGASTPATDVYRLTVPLEEGCVRAEITGESGDVGICEVSVWSAGMLPKTLAMPQLPVERTDFLIVTTTNGSF